MYRKTISPNPNGCRTHEDFNKDCDFLVLVEERKYLTGMAPSTDLIYRCKRFDGTLEEARRRCSEVNQEILYKWNSGSQ